MKPKTIMVVAGDPSGDANAAELVKALSEAIPKLQNQITSDVQPLTGSLKPRFIGAGGPKMAEAGVELSFNLTDHAVIGPADVFKKFGLFWRRFQELVKLAKDQLPDLIILVDFYTFNQRLAHKIKKFVRSEKGTFENWDPKIVQFTSPQVWASRPARAEKLARDIDLLLCLFPFEKEWYAQRGTKVRVEFVGHPMFDRHSLAEPIVPSTTDTPVVVLLPGSRRGELKRHLPVMLAAAHEIAARQRVHFKLIAPSESLAAYVRSFQLAGMPKVEIQVGHLAEALSSATIAIASTGTVTMECAYFGLPTVALYKTSTTTYLLARRIVTVKYLAMPNILAGEAVFPEFIQGQATPENVGASAIKLLTDPVGRAAIQTKLRRIIESLGGPGSIQRAADAILKLQGPVWEPDIKAAL